MGNLVVCVACKKKTCTYYTVILAPSNHANKISYNCIFLYSTNFYFLCIIYMFIVYIYLFRQGKFSKTTYSDYTNKMRPKSLL